MTDPEIDRLMDEAGAAIGAPQTVEEWYLRISHPDVSGTLKALSISLEARRERERADRASYPTQPPDAL